MGSWRKRSCCLVELEASILRVLHCVVCQEGQILALLSNDFQENLAKQLAEFSSLLNIFKLTRSQFLKVAEKTIIFMELQLFGKGLSKWISSSILHLAVSSPGHRLASTWLLTVLAFELPSSCCGWLCHCIFCKNYSVITLRQEMVELSQHSAFWFMLLHPTLLQSSDLQLHYFGLMIWEIFNFLMLKYLQKDTGSGPFHPNLILKPV